jgi:hypothetical protein
MASGYVANAKMALQKLFDPIGLGSLDGVSLIDYHDGRIEWRPLTQKAAAAPAKGVLWLQATLTWGHYNGPKKRIAILTDGDEVLLIADTSTIKLTLDNKEEHRADKALTKFVLNQIRERVF